MEAIERMVEEILATAQKESDTRKEKALKTINGSFEKEKEKVLIAFEEEKKKLENLSQQEFKREKQSVENASNLLVLGFRQTLLNQVFDEAVKKTNAMPKEEFSEVVKTALAELPTEKDGEVIVGENSKDIFPSEVLSNFPNLKQSNETLPDKSGFVVNFSGIEYNFLFDALIKEVKKTQKGAIAQTLWGE